MHSGIVWRTPQPQAWNGPRRARTIVAATPTVDSATADPSDGSTAGREGVILFTLAAIQFVSIVDFMIVMPLGPQLLADLGIDARKFSWVVSAYTLAAGLAGLLAAPWLDRLTR